MTIRRAMSEGIQQLTSAQVPSATLAAELLLLHVLGRDRAFLYAHPEAGLTLEQERAYLHLLTRRAAGQPTQYLTRRQEFWGLELRVEPGVFIPRPETEHVVEVALEIVRERLAKRAARIVDVGTGTGCIALALASELPQAEILATDISDEALALARANAEALGLAPRVRFVKCELLGAFLSHHGCPAADFDTRSFDLIVSNPPYVSPKEADLLPREVREHEPSTALFSPDDGMEITRRLIEQATVLLSGPGLSPAVESDKSSRAFRSEAEIPRSLREAPEGSGGWIVLELGYIMSGRVRALSGEGWTHIETTNDLRGIPRVLSAQKA